MPAKPQWYRRIPAALDTLRQPGQADIDRAALERLLRVSRRDAVRLLNKFGASQVGNALKIDRAELIRCLEAVASGQDYQAERRRQQTAARHLVQAEQDVKARSIPIPAPPSIPLPTISGLPETVALEPGRLSIRYRDPEDLLQQLLILARSICHDHHAFLELTRPE